MKNRIEDYKDFESKIVASDIFDHPLFTSVVNDSAMIGVNADYPTEATSIDIQELVEMFPIQHVILFVPHEYVDCLSDMAHFSYDISTLRKDHKHMIPIGILNLSTRDVPVFKYPNTFYRKGFTSYKGKQLYQLLLVLREERDISHISIINCTLP